MVVGFLSVVYLALHLVLGSPSSLPLVALAGAALVWASVTDMRALRIPDGAVAVVAVSGVAALVLEEAGALWLHVAVAVSVGAALWALSEAFYRWRGFDGFGLGDVKLIAAGAIWTGPAALPSMLILAAGAGLVAGIVLRRRLIPFGPFIAIAIWIVLHAGALF